jgi:hypothetical protein
LRAVLTQDNMVGLAYIYDPAKDPKDHIEMAKRLRRNFNDEFVMIVFKLQEPGGCTGDVLLKPLSGGPAKTAYEAGNSQVGILKLAPMCQRWVIGHQFVPTACSGCLSPCTVSDDSDVW